MTFSPTVIFWGAGATTTLGMRQTDRQSQFIRELAPSPKSPQEQPLLQRVRRALGDSAYEPWISAVNDLLIILGDEEVGEPSVGTVTPDQMAAMGRNWRKSAGDDELRNRIITLRTWYDWPALESIINVCPADQDGGFRLTDLFNVLDMHGRSGHGFQGRQREFLTLQQVMGARNALKMLLQMMFYVDWQMLCRGGGDKRRDLEHHYHFAAALGRRMQRQGLKLAERFAYDSKEFYGADVSFASMNYDPIALWCQFVANRNLNQDSSVPHVGSPAYKLQIYHDLGHFVATPRVVKRPGQGRLWHPMNQSSAQRLNDGDHGSSERARISKFLFPHGCLWWRECPSCGKLSSFMGDTWDRASRSLIPPPPLKAFIRDVEFRHRAELELEEWKKGAVDARACVHCEVPTYAHHTPAMMQSNFKGAPPPFIEEIQRDLRIAVQEAHHIIFMGYSLPADDVDYRAFFATRRRHDPDRPVKCSVVIGTEGEQRWLGPTEWPRKLAAMQQGCAPRSTLEAARDLFEEKNVRFFGGGIPAVFLGGRGQVTDFAVDQLLNWEDGG